jgi:hypothetical protein
MILATEQNSVNCLPGEENPILWVIASDEAILHLTGHAKKLQLSLPMGRKPMARETATMCKMIGMRWHGQKYERTVGSTYHTHPDFSLETLQIR